MDWCDQNGVAFIFGLAGSKPLQAKVEETADAIRTRRAVETREALRGYAETTHTARTWPHGEDLEQGAPGRGPHRGDPARARHPLCGDQSHDRHARLALRQSLLRPRPGGKSDQ